MVSVMMVNAGKVRGLTGLGGSRSAPASQPTRAARMLIFSFMSATQSPPCGPTEPPCSTLKLQSPASSSSDLRQWFTELAMMVDPFTIAAGGPVESNGLSGHAATGGPYGASLSNITRLGPANPDVVQIATDCPVTLNLDARIHARSTPTSTY